MVGLLVGVSGSISVYFQFLSVSGLKERILGGLIFLGIGCSSSLSAGSRLVLNQLLSCPEEKSGGC